MCKCLSTWLLAGVLFASVPVYAVQDAPAAPALSVVRQLTNWLSALISPLTSGTASDTAATKPDGGGPYLDPNGGGPYLDPNGDSLQSQPNGGGPYLDPNGSSVN